MVRIMIITVLSLILVQYWIENDELTKQELDYDSLLCKNYQIMKQNDSLQREIYICKWQGAREYYSINKNIK